MSETAEQAQVLRHLADIVAGQHVQRISIDLQGEGGRLNDATTEAVVAGLLASTNETPTIAFHSESDSHDEFATIAIPVGTVRLKVFTSVECAGRLARAGITTEDAA